MPVLFIRSVCTSSSLITSTWRAWLLLQPGRFRRCLWFIWHSKPGYCFSVAWSNGILIINRFAVVLLGKHVIQVFVNWFQTLTCFWLQYKSSDLDAFCIMLCTFSLWLVSRSFKSCWKWMLNCDGHVVYEINHWSEVKWISGKWRAEMCRFFKECIFQHCFIEDGILIENNTDCLLRAHSTGLHVYYV